MIKTNMVMNRFFLVALVMGCLLQSSGARAADSDDPFAATTGFMAPSAHLSVGVRTLAAPTLDEFYSAYGGVKLSLFNIGFGQIYLSLGAIGLHIQRDRLFLLGLTPIMINHAFGVGIGFPDLFMTSDRPDRPGGPLGISLNVDIVRLIQSLSQF